MTKYRYHHLKVPDNPVENAKWRAETRRLTELPHSEKLRQEIVEKCRKEFWYWAKGFAYVHEPRILDDGADFAAGVDTAVAYLPWPHQTPIVDALLERLGKKSTRIVKSRAQGASWIIVLIAIWCWLFHRGSKINLVSKDEDTVDRKGDMDALLSKADWLIDKLPEWMVGAKRKQWDRNYTNHTLTRLDGETAIAGFACTGDVASGGRALMFVLDEHAKHPRGPDREALAATQFITRCRVFVSTPKGNTGAFAEIIHDDTIAEPVLHLSWRDNPTQNRGYYTIQKGYPVAVDEELYGPLPEEYRDAAQWLKLKTRLKERGYDLTDKKPRSQWYDQQCLESGADPVLIAQELDEQFGVESVRFFSQDLVNRLLNQADMNFSRGDFYVDNESLTGFWSDNPDGYCKLWCQLDISNRPPMGEYIVACDISLGLGGSGGSNSCITVLNRRTGRKVMAYACPRTEPHQFAELAIGICRWFCNHKGDPAFLIWENQGPGKTFCQRVERSGFQHYYRRPASGDAPLHARQTDRPGYWNQKPEKLLGPYKEALLEGYFYNPDKDAIEELKEYQLDQKGTPYHVASRNKADPAGAGAAHADRCFVAGTMILTNRGERPIDQLSPGDLVWTRDGLRPVVACGITGEEQVFEVKLSNGRSLTGTGNHPVWTENRSWFPLGSLTRWDKLLTWQHQHPEDEVRPCQQKQFEAVGEKRVVYNLSVAETPEYFAQGVLVHNCIADALAWHASVRFGDQHEKHAYGRKTVNVLNVREEDVARTSFAWRRAQYLRMLGKQKEKSTW